MNLATLRVEGNDDALAHLCDVLRCNLDATWKKGELKRRGGIHMMSGFSATIADSANPAEMIVTVRRFLADCKALGLDFVGADLYSELAIGVAVGDSVQFIAIVDLTAGDLSLLGSLGINLSIAAYPTSDEENVIDDTAA